MARQQGVNAAAARSRRPRPAHAHVWRALDRGHRPGGSDDDPEVYEQYEVCQKCGELRKAFAP